MLVARFLHCTPEEAAPHADHCALMCSASSITTRLSWSAQGNVQVQLFVRMQTCIHVRRQIH